jgi:SAM-dependent methyltransferase
MLSPIASNLDGTGFYRDALQGRTPAREELLGLVERVLERRGAGSLAPLVAEHLASWGEPLWQGASPPRPDAAWTAWDDERARHFVAMEGRGARHLELGTWKAFPDDRVAALSAADGLSLFTRLDADDEFANDVVGDAMALPLRDGSYDRVVHDSLIEHVPSPERVITEGFRVLRPGGVMACVTPFVLKRHGYPQDFVRLTPDWFEHTCRAAGFSEVHVDTEAQHGLYYVLHHAAKTAAVDASHPSADALRELHELVLLLLGALVPLDRGFEGGSRDWFHSVRVLAVKPGAWEPPEPAALDSLLGAPGTGAALSRSGRTLRGPDGARYPVAGGRPHFLPRSPLPVRARRVARRVRQRLSS